MKKNLSYMESVHRDGRIWGIIDKVTDVLSFPYFEGLKLPKAEEDFCDSDFHKGKVALGSIMICRQRAIEQAQEYGHSIEREMGFLTCHGLLHLLGYDHLDEGPMKAQMRAREEAIAATIPGMSRV